jgi:hypothetical protein
MVDASIDGMAESVSEALSSIGSEAMADSEIEAILQNQLSKHHKHHHKHHEHKDAKKAAPKALAQASAKPVAKAPASKSLLATKVKNGDQLDNQSFNVDVPIDEEKLITLNVKPHYLQDHVESVTLKSFRKVVGYDTFNSILKGDRNEAKDLNDYYNVTVSMMIKRVPETVAALPVHDLFDGTKTLS